MSEKVKAYGVSVTLPDGWLDRSVYTFVGPEQSIDEDLPILGKPRGFRPNVVVTREETSDSLETYCRTQFSAARNQLPDLKLLDERRLDTRMGPALARAFTFAAQGTTVHQYQVFVARNSFVYTFTFSTLPQMAEAIRPLFDQILESATLD